MYYMLAVEANRYVGVLRSQQYTMRGRVVGVVAVKRWNARVSLNGQRADVRVGEQRISECKA